MTVTVDQTVTRGRIGSAPTRRLPDQYAGRLRVRQLRASWFWAQRDNPATSRRSRAYRGRPQREPRPGASGISQRARAPAISRPRPRAPGPANPSRSRVSVPGAPACCAGSAGPSYAHNVHDLSGAKKRHKLHGNNFKRRSGWDVSLCTLYSCWTPRKMLSSSPERIHVLV